MDAPVRQGTTPSLIFWIEGYDLTDKTVYLTFSSKGKEIMTKENEDLYITYDEGISTIFVRLTQEETLNMPLGSAQVQARWIGQGGEAPATNIRDFNVAPVLHKKVIEYKEVQEP